MLATSYTLSAITKLGLTEAAGERFGGCVGVDGGVDRLQVLGDLAAVLVGHKAQRLADQMHVMPTSA